jgi:SAM-dependent methyltransferase
MAISVIPARAHHKIDEAKEQAEVEKCLLGEKLYGDDFGPAEIEIWFRDEESAYYDLSPRDARNYTYGYHCLNWMHGFSALPNRTFRHVLGIGSAFGEELDPLTERVERITILEPSPGFVVRRIRDVPVTYVKPEPSGKLPFAEGEFDLITCFSVLHHIPNVSKVLVEMFRCTVPGGYVLVREPIVSMGDWRCPRKGLTRRERGIPLKIFRRMIAAAGFETVRERKFMFPVTRRLGYFVKSPVFNSRFLTTFDALISCLPVWSTCYHPQRFVHKFRPEAIFLVLQRPAASNSRRRS